jgi:hypothetical protein
VEPVTGKLLELKEPGDYIVFLEGAPDDPMWRQTGTTWVQLIDDLTRQPLSSTSQGIDYSFDHDGRHAQSVCKVSAQRAGFLELALSRSDGGELSERGIKVSLAKATLVDSQSWRASGVLVGGIVAGVLIGIVSLGLLTAGRNN